jgi:hypothetical protein
MQIKQFNQLTNCNSTNNYTYSLSDILNSLHYRMPEPSFMIPTHPFSVTVRGHLRRHEDQTPQHWHMPKF